MESWAGLGNEANRNDKYMFDIIFFPHIHSPHNFAPLYLRQMCLNTMTYCVLVKALFCREVHEVLAHTQVPLGHDGSAVANCLQGLCDCGFIQRETCTSGERQRVNSNCVK